MTLRHKNQGKWAKRVLERGLSKQDEGTQAAIAEQLHLHNLLTRKMNSVKENSSSDDSSCEDDEDMDSSDEEGASKLLAKAKEKTIKLMEQEDEVPDSGVLSLPFMVYSAHSCCLLIVYLTALFCILSPCSVWNEILRSLKGSPGKRMAQKRNSKDELCFSLHFYFSGH